MREPYEKGVAIRSASSLALLPRGTQRRVDRRAATSTCGPGDRRQTCPTCRGHHPQPDLRGGLSRLLLRVSPGAQPASGAGCVVVRAPEEEGELVLDADIRGFFLGRFTVRRKTIRKRMPAKLQEVKQQLRERMHDPVLQTGPWLKSILQGHFNYSAVPGNLDSLGVFRDRLIGQWWRTLRRRSQKHPISWTRILALADRWFPQPRVLHPYPAVRFADSHPR